MDGVDPEPGMGGPCRSGAASIPNEYSQHAGHLSYNSIVHAKKTSSPALVRTGDQSMTSGNNKNDSSIDEALFLVLLLYNGDVSSALFQIPDFAAKLL